MTDVACSGCGFVWAHLGTTEVPARLHTSSQRFVATLNGHGHQASERPTPTTCSPLEYGGHVRDVLISIRERIIAAVVADHPTGLPIYREERIGQGFYDLDTMETVSTEILTVSDLLARTITLLPEGSPLRTMIYSPVSDAAVTVE